MQGIVPKRIVDAAGPAGHIRPAILGTPSLYPVGPLPVSCGAPPCILLASSMGKRKCQGVEQFGLLELPLGGVNTYVGVRKARNGEFQGYTDAEEDAHDGGVQDDARGVRGARAAAERHQNGHLRGDAHRVARYRCAAAPAPLPLRLRSHCTVD
jgi:hypothetical protein